MNTATESYMMFLACSDTLHRSWSGGISTKKESSSPTRVVHAYISAPQKKISNIIKFQERTLEKGFDLSNKEKQERNLLCDFTETSTAG